jgi:hypothetical protein
LTPIHLAKGYHEGLDILFPPEDDEWWNGGFTHFNFDRVFNEIANSVPKTMADKSFKDLKWNINSRDENEPEHWDDSEIYFFSDYFVEFLETGKI